MVQLLDVFAEGTELIIVVSHSQCCEASEIVQESKLCGNQTDYVLGSQAL
jgi:hypothetical protein